MWKNMILQVKELCKQAKLANINYKVWNIFQQFMKYYCWGDIIVRKKLLAVVFAFLILITNSISVFALAKKDNQPFKVEPLTYSYDALEPYIS